jgi:hypothetical protein
MLIDAQRLGQLLAARVARRLAKAFQRLKSKAKRRHYGVQGSGLFGSGVGD